MLLVKKKKIKVVFMYQWKQGYIKFKDVILRMINDDIFEVKLLVFPENIHDLKNKEIIKYSHKIFPDVDIIDASIDNGWYDLKKYKPDYVFIQRPYDIYLPVEYSLEELEKYTKICYIPYGYDLVKIQNVTLPPNVIKKIYLLFAQNDDVYEYAKKAVNITNQKKHIKNIGYPVLDSFLQKNKQTPSAFNNINSNNFKIVWTPRWTTDKEYFATTFFEYKDKIMKYLKNKPNLQLVFRPHPLMFNNFIEKGLMTKREVKDYIENLPCNVYYDTEGDYFETFIDSDLLITDMTSILLDYFILEKPIILCGDNDEKKYTKVMKKISKNSYKVDNWRNLKKVLEDLQKGIDPKNENRKKFINEIQKTNDGKVAKKIVDCIKNDFHK